MSSTHDELPIYLPSPARRAPSQVFDYLELVADEKFHAVVVEHKRNGTFAGLDEGTPEYNSKLKELAIAFVGVVNEKRVTLFRNRGILYGRKGEFREAISCYNRALELSKNSVSRHVTLANRSAAYIKSEKIADALEDAQEAAALCVEYSIAHSLMGYCHSRLGMDKKAVVNYNMALELNPADVSTQNLLVDAKKALLASGEPLTAIEALELPFLAKRAPKQEEAAIEAAVAAALEMPVDYRQHLDRSQRASSIEEEEEEEGAEAPKAPVLSPVPVEGGRVSPERGRRSRRNSVDKASPDRSTERPKRLYRILSSGSAQAFASLSQLPNKLKHSIGKKAKRRSKVSQGDRRRNDGQHPAGDFTGLFRNVVEDAAGAPTALPAMSTSAATIPCAADSQQVSAGLFCATGPPAGDSVLQNSGSGGEGMNSDPRGDQQQQQKQQQQQQGRALAPEIPTPTRPSQTTVDQRPGANSAIGRQLERRSKIGKNNDQDGETPTATALERRQPGTSSPHEGAASGIVAKPAKPSLLPLSPRKASDWKPQPHAPGQRIERRKDLIGAVQVEVCLKAPLPQPQLKEKKASDPATGVASTAAKSDAGGNICGQGEASRLAGDPSWAPEKGGYASSESSFSDGSWSSSKNLEAIGALAPTTPCHGGGGGGQIQSPSTASKSMAMSNRVVQLQAMVGRHPPGLDERPPEKSAWTTSGSISDDGDEEGSGFRLLSNTLLAPKVLIWDEEEGMEGEAIRGVFGGDADDGSAVVARGISRGGEGNIRGGPGQLSRGGAKQEKLVETFAVPKMELGHVLESERGASEAKVSANVLAVRGGIATKGSAAVAAVAAAETASSKHDDTNGVIETPTSLQQSLSARARMIRSERKAQPSAEKGPGEDTPHSGAVDGKMIFRRRMLSRSRSAYAREKASPVFLESATTPTSKSGGLTRTLSCLVPAALTSDGATPPIPVKPTADPPVAGKGVSRLVGSRQT